MDPKNTNFRIILALTSLPQDVDLNGASLKVTAAGSTKSVPLSDKEATPLDFSGVQLGSKLEFGVEDTEGFMFGYSELKIPNAAFEKNEIEITEQLRFYLINKEKEFFVANVYAIFLNKGLFKEKAKERGSVNTARPTLNKSKSGERLVSKSPSSSPSRRSPSKGKAYETKVAERNFQAYLHRLVDSHSNQMKDLVDEHNSINEYIHLNREQKNLPNSFAEKNLEAYSPVKLRTSANLSTLGDESPITSFSQVKVGRVATEESRIDDRSVLRDLSPMVEREKKAIATLPDDETPAKRQIADESSPLRIKGALQRKLSEGASPSKRKQITDILTISSARREVADTAFYNAQITTLNNVIVNQKAKISNLDIYRNENESLVVGMQKSEGARKALQASILETTQELKQENKNLEKLLGATITEKEVLIKKNTDLEDTIHTLTGNLTLTKMALKEHEDLNTQNLIKLAELSDLKLQFKALQESLIISETQKKRDQEDYKLALARFQLSLEDTTRAIDLLNLEKKKLAETLFQTQQELGLERVNHQATQNDLLLTKKRLENAENYKVAVASLEAQRDSLTQQLANSRNNQAQTQRLLEDSELKLAARQKVFEQNERTFLQDFNALNDKFVQSEAKNDRLAKELSEQKLRVSQLTTTVSSLEQVLCVKEDVGKQLDATEKQLAQVLADRKELRVQLDNVTLTQEQINNRLFEIEKEGNLYRQTIEEKDEQIEQLTATVIALRESMEMYIPTKGDVIDNAVADYINTGTDVSRLKLLFIRETEGVYQFGSKRLYVKLEGGKILIRVGGGFLAIEEFIEQYGPLETDKLVRTDPLKKLSKNIAINKTLIGKCVNQIEKNKTQVYEYRSDASSVRMLNSSPTFQRSGSKGDLKL